MLKKNNVLEYNANIVTGFVNKKWGDAVKFTINDIARLANVSKATVSRVINNKPQGVSQEVREKVLKIIEEVGYQPSLLARGVATSHTCTIGVIVPDIINPFFQRLVVGIEHFADEKGYTVLLGSSNNETKKEKRYIDVFRSKGIDGLIITTSGSPQDTKHGNINTDIPVVLVDRKEVGFSYNVAVYGDNKKGGYLATKYLLEQGYKKIAFLGGPRYIENTRDRLLGYKKAYEEKHLPIDKANIIFGEYGAQSGEKMTRQLLDNGSVFDAIFAACDYIAIGAIKELNKEGHDVPKDIGVVGFDNIYMGELFDPALTTVDQHVEQMAEHATHLLIEMIEDKMQDKTFIQEKLEIQPTLVIRHSS